MDKLLSYRIRSRSKSRERTDNTLPKPEDVGATALEIKPIKKEPDAEINTKNKSEIDEPTKDLSSFQILTSKSDVKSMKPSHKLKTERIDEKIFDHLSKEAQELPDDFYCELVTHADGSPLYYFGATTFTRATKAILVKDDKIYALDPKKMQPPDDDEQHTYEDPDQTRNVTGTKPKQTMQNINLLYEAPVTMTNKSTQKINEEISQINEKLNEMKDLINTIKRII